MPKPKKDSTRVHMVTLKLNDNELTQLDEIVSKVTSRYPYFDLDRASVIRFLIGEANRSWNKRGELKEG